MVQDDSSNSQSTILRLCAPSARVSSISLEIRCPGETLKGKLVDDQGGPSSQLFLPKSRSCQAVMRTLCQSPRPGELQGLYPSP